MRPWPVLLLVPLLVPSALAQEPLTVTADAPAAPLDPGGEAVELPVRVEVPCEALARERGSVELSVRRTPAWATARVEPGTLDPPLGAPCSMAWTGEARLFVAANPGAPALREDVVSVSARLGDAERAADVPVRAAFEPGLRIEADDAPRTGKPQSVLTFEVRVTNLGNGPTKVSFEVAPPPRFQAPQPSPVTLQAALDGPQTAVTVPVTVLTPYHNGRVDESGVVTVRVLHAHALDPTLAGPPETLAFPVHAVGTYVPGAGAALAVGALALLAAAFRR